MPRLPRVYIKESSYYITCKGLPGQKVFNDNRDYEMYFSLLKKYKEELKVNIFSYCLLSDHLHLLVDLDEQTTISAFMHKLNSAYTKYYNSRYERKGHLFRERFQTAFVEKSPQTLLEVSTYMHRNSQRLPVTADADAYPHSSFGLYRDYDRHHDHGLNLRAEISMLVNAVGKDNFARVMEQQWSADENQRMHKALHRTRMLGSETFVHRVKQEIAAQREAVEEEDDVPPRPASTRFWVFFAVLMVGIALAISGTYWYLSARSVRLNPPGNHVLSAAVPVLTDLDRTEWQILLKGAGEETRADVISFQNGKFASGNLQALAYPQTNYSAVREAGKLVWETMQTSASGTASWRGEMEQNTMRGVLSLRESGRDPQDFYFTSVKFRTR